MKNLLQINIDQDKMKQRLGLLLIVMAVTYLGFIVTTKTELLRGGLEEVIDPDTMKIEMESPNGPAQEKVGVGKNGYALYKFAMSSNDIDLQLKKLTLTLSGRPGNIKTLKLYKKREESSTESLLYTLSSPSSTSIEFSGLSAPINEGEKTHFIIKADIKNDATPGNTLRFSIENLSDVEFYDFDNNVGVEDAGDFPKRGRTYTIVAPEDLPEIFSGESYLRFDKESYNVGETAEIKMAYPAIGAAAGEFRVRLTSYDSMETEYDTTRNDNTHRVGFVNLRLTETFSGSGIHKVRVKFVDDATDVLADPPELKVALDAGVKATSSLVDSFKDTAQILTPAPVTLVESAPPVTLTVAPLEPTLSVQSIEFSPAVPKENNIISFLAKIRNSSRTDSVAAKVTLEIDKNNDRMIETTSEKRMKSGYIAENDYDTIEFKKGWKASAGTHRYKICVHENALPPEEKNCKDKIFTVASPDERSGTPEPVTSATSRPSSSLTSSSSPSSSSLSGTAGSSIPIKPFIQRSSTGSGDSDDDDNPPPSGEILSLDFNKSTYTLTESPNITLTAENRNADPSRAEEVDIQISSTSDREGIILTLEEINVNSDTFQKSFTLTGESSNSRNRALKAACGDTIEARYAPPGTSEVATDATIASCGDDGDGGGDGGDDDGSAGGPHATLEISAAGPSLQPTTLQPTGSQLVKVMDINITKTNGAITDAIYGMSFEYMGNFPSSQIGDLQLWNETPGELYAKVASNSDYSLTKGLPGHLTAIFVTGLPLNASKKLALYMYVDARAANAEKTLQYKLSGMETEPSDMTQNYGSGAASPIYTVASPPPPATSGTQQPPAAQLPIITLPPAGTQVASSPSMTPSPAKKPKKQTPKKKAAKKTPAQQTAQGADGATEGGQRAAAPRTDVRSSAYSPNLETSQRLVSAPDRSETGPGIAVYFGAIAAAQGVYWWRRRKKRHSPQNGA